MGLSVHDPFVDPLGNPLGLSRAGADISPIGTITTRTSGPAANELETDGRQLLKADYSKLYAAIGDAYSVADFTAGFTAVTLPNALTWTSIAYGNGVFVVTCSNAAIFPVSFDGGLTWGSVSPPAGAWTAITFGNGVFVAVASGSAICATSPDGIVWTQRAMPASTSWSAVTYGKGRFVAVAQLGAGAYSDDGGQTWTSASTGNGSSGARAISFGGGMFVLVISGTTVAMSSPDGVTWTARTLPSSASWSSVAYGNGVFVAVANTSGAIPAVSVNGMNWFTGIAQVNGVQITFGQGVFYAVVVGISAAFYSTDGVNWASVGVSPPITNLSATTFGGGAFVSIKTGTASVLVQKAISPTNFNLPNLKPLDNRSTAYIKVA